ncbi:hypothetical protein HELRODRAFT_77403 [Helobdella robusta]|uniref:Xanthine dehydrogenase n=1 Tax=Helobdella robusta TaxID=6412 RepID=T1G2X1_HELRO|nr:hypothetical protein HELRODRAFT_77403 [Helobdella robusta]ESO05727.1 hypothetical protein HELRODRAFT_77403 [Helobdella robusta]
MDSTLTFYVNGEKVNVLEPDPDMSLLTYLRDICEFFFINNIWILFGTKYGCGEGGCGTCTVLLTKIVNNVPKHLSLNSCLIPLCAMHGAAVTTVEGIGSIGTRLHPVQEVLAEKHGTQCGYCSPGFVMSMYVLLCNNPHPRELDIEEALQGNLCRCTGYRPIVQGFISTFARHVSLLTSANSLLLLKSKGCSGQEDMREGELDGSTGNKRTNHEKNGNTVLHTINNNWKKSPKLDSQYLCFKSNHVTWYRPTKLNELLYLKVKHPQAKLVAGNTEIGIETRFKNMEYPVIIYDPVECCHGKKDGDGDQNIWVGASVTLESLEEFLDGKISSLPECQTRLFAAMKKVLQLFGSQQIKNVASLGGNLMNASPISDLIPLLVCARSKMTIASERGQREIVLKEDFFTGYQQVAMDPQEVLLHISLPYSRPLEYFCSLKMSRRREDDVAIVNSALWIRFKRQSHNLHGSFVVDDVIIAYGGMRGSVFVATNTMNVLRGKKWNETLLDEAVSSLSKETSLKMGSPGGMEAYRSTLALSFFFKFFVHVSLQMKNDYFDKPVLPPSLNASNNNNDNNNNSSSYSTTSNNCNINRTFEKKQVGGLSIVGQPVMHSSALKHCTGEAVYVDDMPRYKDELFLSFVLSTKAHAKILEIDYSEVLKCDGVAGVMEFHDVNGINLYAKIFKDDDITSSNTVITQHQPILGVLSRTKIEGRRAVKKVKVQYEELAPILSIKEAIENNSYLGSLPPFQNGYPLTVMKTCEFVIEGEVSLGGQEHFYLETNACLVVPLEDGGVEVWSSTQNPQDVQRVAADVLGVSSSKVMVRVGRIGGGFGGKENKPLLISLPSIVAAKKFNRPIRCTLDRDEDMMVTGGRHPFLAKYKVGFRKDGHIEALVISLYANCGCSKDASDAAMEKVTFQLDNMYHFRDILIDRFMCRTNLPSNTVFRGSGAPQATFICETIMEHVACHLKLPSLAVRELNMYKCGESTMYNQLVDCEKNLRNCWFLTKDGSQYDKQLKEIEEFNRTSRWVKRGLSLNGMKYGIGFPLSFYHQAGALINVYRDGSVLLSHGGTEMGQGLHTKMIQVAAEVLQISTSLVHIHETNSHIIPNSSPTAASSSSDLYGMAVVLACEKIMKRLEPYMKSKPEGGWKSWIERAFIDRVQLTATGFYKKAFNSHDIKSNKGLMYHYYSVGAACSVVEIDCLTGALQVLRTDIVMDVGKSLNPAIDVGQIEGAFVQGFGLYTMEELKYSADGRLLMNGPGVYKIPTLCDTPRVFNVTLLKNSKNLKAVYSSKAIGEPPLLLAVSVVGAIRHAITSARHDAGLTNEWFRLDSPVTCERIRMACTDQFTHLFKEDDVENYKPWYKDII